MRPPFVVSVEVSQLLVINERMIFIRERANGMYSAGPYFISKVRAFY